MDSQSAVNDIAETLRTGDARDAQPAPDRPSTARTRPPNAVADDVHETERLRRTEETLPNPRWAP